MTNKPFPLLRIPLLYVRDIELGELHGQKAINMVLGPGVADLGPLTYPELDSLIIDLQNIRSAYCK